MNLIANILPNLTAGISRDGRTSHSSVLAHFSWFLFALFFGYSMIIFFYQVFTRSSSPNFFDLYESFHDTIFDAIDEEIILWNNRLKMATPLI